MAKPEQLHGLLTYCLDFAQTMLVDSGEFYPFGAVINAEGELEARGGWNGEEHPKPAEINDLLVRAFRTDAGSGRILAAAIAVNVNVPYAYSPPFPDGVRVALESPDDARFIYTPYRLRQEGLLKKRRTVEFAEPFAVAAEPAFFVKAGA